MSDGTTRAAGGPKDPVGIAVIGAGYWGPNLVRNAMATPTMRVEWLCDLDEARAKAVLGPYSTVRTTTSIDTVLDDPAVRAVAVATPAGTHGEVALRAIDAGKHVLVEKPLAASYTEGVKLVDAADARGVVLMCDHTYCYTPAVGAIRELVHGGELGDIHYVDAVRINLGLVQRDVNVLWDLAPHDLSILDFILPEGVHPTAVAAHGADPIGAGQVCIAYLTLQLSSGAIAHAHVNWLSPTKIRTTVVGGSRKTLVWDDLDPARRVQLFDRGVDLTDPKAMPGEKRDQLTISYRSGDMLAPALSEREPLRAVMGEFAAAISEGRPALTDGRAGLRVLDILEAASRSLEFHGATVPLQVAR